MPLVQGIGWNLVVFGWRFWNRGTKFGGRTVGSKVRRWWWGVNNWELPKEAKTMPPSGVEDVRIGPRQVVLEFDERFTDVRVSCDAVLRGSIR